MKVLAAIVLCVAYVAARGSGPYLPRGWKPDGPAFYLPSEVLKPVGNPVKEVFQESVASGSDSLLEYGPPKIQEVSQELSQQGLPDFVNEQLFIETVVEAKGAKENSAAVLAEVTEQTSEDNSQIKSSVEEAAAVTESQTNKGATSVAENEISNSEVETDKENAKGTTAASIIESEIIEANEAIPTAAAVETTQETITTGIEQAISQEIIADSQEGASNQQQSEQAISQIIGRTAVDASVVANEQESTNVNQQESSSVLNSATTISQQSESNFEVVSNVEEKIQTVQEEVKKVEQAVQNIPELIVSLENEVRAQKAETIQEISGVVQETLGSLEQTPEGFLEYGPPGFREYGPPNADLRDNTIEEKTVAAQLVAGNEARRRRFSPKFRPSKKLH